MSIERVDSYTVKVNGVFLTADEEHEAFLRTLTPTQLDNLVRNTAAESA